MTIFIRIAIVLAGSTLLISIFRAMILRKITERQGILWMIPGFLIILGGIFPKITYFLADTFHVTYAPSMIFSMAIIFLYLILFECFKTLSVLTSKNQELAMQISLLNQENERILQHLSKNADKEKSKI